MTLWIAFCLFVTTTGATLNLCVYISICDTCVRVCLPNEILEVKLMDVRGGAFGDLDGFAKLSFQKAGSISNPSIRVLGMLFTYTLATPRIFRFDQHSDH